MVLRAVTAEKAMEYFHGNTLFRWGPDLANEHKPLKPEWAAARLQQTIFEAGIRPSFKLKRGDLVYAAGSCFARNIEKNLLLNGMNLLFNPEEIRQRPEFEVENTAYRENFLIKYNTPTILNDIFHAGNEGEDRRLVYELSPGQFFDARLGAYPLTDFDTIMARRQFIRQKSREIGNCACVIFTLGLSEAWFDIEAGEYLNYFPDLRFVNNHRRSLELHILDYDQHVALLRKAINMLKERGVENVVITVSPVPLISTFTEEDVVVANEYSKAALRAAAAAVCAETGADYFPSYEMVKYSDRQYAWRGDARHVTDPMVAEVTGRFVRNYVE